MSDTNVSGVIKTSFWGGPTGGIAGCGRAPSKPAQKLDESKPIFISGDDFEAALRMTGNDPCSEEVDESLVNDIKNPTTGESLWKFVAKVLLQTASSNKDPKGARLRLDQAQIERAASKLGEAPSFPSESLVSSNAVYESPYASVESITAFKTFDNIFGERLSQAVEVILMFIENEADLDPKYQSYLPHLPAYFEKLSSTSKGKKKALHIINQLKKSPINLYYILFEISRGRYIKNEYKILLKSRLDGKNLEKINSLSAEKILDILISIQSYALGNEYTLFNPSSLIKNTYDVSEHKINFINFNYFDPPNPNASVKPPHNLMPYLTTNIFHKSMDEYNLSDNSEKKALLALRFASRKAGFKNIKSLSIRESIIVAAKATEILLKNFDGHVYAETIDERIDAGGGVCHDYSETFVSLFMILKRINPNLVNSYPNIFSGAVGFRASGHAWNSVVIVDEDKNFFGTIVDPTWAAGSSPLNALDIKHSGIINDMDYYYSAGDLDKREEIGLKYLSFYEHSNDAKKLYLCGRIYNQLGHYDSALKIYLRILDTASDEQIVLDTLEVISSLYYFYLKDEEKAFQYYKRITEEYPNSGETSQRAWGRVGGYYKSKGDLEKTIECYKKAYRCAPLANGDSYLFDMAEIYDEKFQDYAKAVSLYKKFIRVFPKHRLIENVYFNLGNIYKDKLHKPNYALKYYRLILKNPNGSYYEEAKQKISEIKGQ